MQVYYDLWYEKYGLFPTQKQRTALNKFATLYSVYIGTLIPNLNAKLNILNAAVLLVLKENKEVSIKTLDGEIIRWTFYETEEKTRHRYNPVDQKSHSYKYTVIKTKKDSSVDVDFHAHKVRFLPYLIHSIDASVLRIFIQRMYEKHKYKINHLHDCVIMHPNYVEAFYEEVELLYSSEELYRIPESLVFEQFKYSISEGARKTLDQYEQEFFY